VILVEDLRKSFGDVRAVDGVDLHVEGGELLVVLGQNGAGKSTTLRCLGGILHPDSGLIELDGLRLPDRLDEVRARLASCPTRRGSTAETPRLSTWTVSGTCTESRRRFAGSASQACSSASSWTIARIQSSRLIREAWLKRSR
jgi:ABC-type Mn2+/Zn2+ transport system ATPase subunit